MRLGDLGGHVAIEKGTAKLQGVEAKSPDGEVALEGEMTLRDPLPQSTMNAYLRFKLSDALLKKEVALSIVPMAAAAGKRPDGFYGLKFAGSFAHPAPPLLTPISPVVSAAVPPVRTAGTPRGAAVPPPQQPPAPPTAPPPSADAGARSRIAASAPAASSAAGGATRAHSAARGSGGRRRMEGRAARRRRLRPPRPRRRRRPAIRRPLRPRPHPAEQPPQ